MNKLLMAFLGLYLALAPPSVAESKRRIEVLHGSLSSHAYLRPDFDYTQTSLRVGLDKKVDLFSINGRDITDVLIEVNHSHVRNWPGDYMVGVLGLFRANLLDKDAQVVPYLQLGAGILVTDTYKPKRYYIIHNKGEPDEEREAKVQENIGGPIEFNIRVSAGLEVRINRTISLLVEYVARDHISNAGMYERNDGVNGKGLVFGVKGNF